MKDKNKNRLIKYYVMAIVATLILVLVGLKTLKDQVRVEEKQATFELTQFNYILNGTSKEQVDEFENETEVIDKVFPIIQMEVEMRGNVTSDIMVLFSDKMENFEIGLLTEATKISGNYDENGIMLDKTAAEKLGVKVGDEVSFTLKGKSVKVKVSAIYRACTYKNLTNGICVMKWTSSFDNMYEKNLKYTYTFIKVKDEALATSYVESFVPMYGLEEQESWIKEHKSDYPKMMIETDDQYASRLIKEYENYKTDYCKTNKLKYQVQDKSDYQKEAAEQTISIVEKVSTVSIVVAISTALVFITIFTIFTLADRKENERVSINGENPGKLMVLNTLPALLSALFVVLVTFLTMLIYSKTQIYSDQYPRIISLFSLPTLISLVINIPIAIIQIRKMYSAAKVNSGVNSDKIIIRANTEYDRNVKIKEKDFIVSLRVYLYNCLACVLMIIGMIVVFLGFGNSLSFETVNYVNYVKADCDEIVYSISPNSKDSFINYNGRLFLLDENDLQINVDVFATVDGMTYENNMLGFMDNEVLNDFECAVGGNILKDYGLNIGDKIKVRGSDIVYTIAYELETLNGIDGKYNHNGVVILKYDDSLKDATNTVSTVNDNVYVSFLLEDDTLPQLEARDNAITYIFKLRAKALASLIVNVVIIVLIFALVIGISEFFITKRIYNSYKIMLMNGVPANAVNNKLLIVMLIQYIAPVAILIPIFLIEYYSYGLAYIIPFILYGLICAIVVIIYNLVIKYRMNNPKYKIHKINDSKVLKGSR